MGWAIDGLIESILEWFAGVVVGGLNLLWDLLAASVFVSPDVTLVPQVRALSRTSLDVVNTLYVLAFLAAFLFIMGRDTLQSRYGPGELIPRLVIGLIAANFAMPLCSTLIEFANALTGALTSQDITSPGSMQQMRAIVTGGVSDQSGSSPAGFLMLLIGLIIAIMVGMLLMQWIARLGVLVVAVGVAPIALALHGTPQTEPAAKLWWRTMFGALGTVVLQAVALHATLTIFLDPDANLPGLSLPGDPGVVFNLLVVLGLLWTVIKIPAMMRRYITKSSPSQVGTFMRVVIVQQLTRGLSRAAGRGGAARIAAASGRGPGGGSAAGHAARSWPVGPSRGGGSRPLPRPDANPLPAAVRTSQAAPARPARVPSRRPAGAGPEVVGTAYPTGRPVKAYTREEIAGGVDVYTQSLRRRAAVTPSRGTRTPSRGTAAPTGRNRS